VFERQNLRKDVIKLLNEQISASKKTCTKVLVKGGITYRFNSPGGSSLRLHALAGMFDPLIFPWLSGTSSNTMGDFTF